MTLANIQNAIYKNTLTTSASYTNANMLLDLNNAAERCHAIIRKHIDNFRPTAWTASDLTTGTALPVFDVLFHELIALWPSYQMSVINNLPSANGFLIRINALEKSMEEFYHGRNYEVFTVTIASPGVFFKMNHGLKKNDRISFITSGALPTGLSVDTFYWIISDGLDDDNFQVSATRDG